MRQCVWPEALRCGGSLAGPLETRTARRASRKIPFPARHPNFDPPAHFVARKGRGWLPLSDRKNLSALRPAPSF